MKHWINLRNLVIATALLLLAACSAHVGGCGGAGYSQNQSVQAVNNIG